ncbi:TraB/GumN family protein [Marilutibacter alkalisoli]|nr:TraB/GumN family protein [Lysobacter alkalisoli]
MPQSLVLLAALYVSGIVPAAADGPVGGGVGMQAVEAEIEAPASPVPLLWKVSDEDNSVYLLGSFHLLKADDHPLSEDIEVAFEDAERLAFEVPPEQVDDPANATLFLQAAAYADGRRLSDVVPPEAHAKLVAMLDQAGMPAAAFETFEPWFVNLTLVLGMAQPMGFSGAHGLDQHFMKRAKAAGKPSIGLESIERQVAVLDGTPMDEQVASLVELVDDPAALAEQLTKLHEAWRSGDAATLQQVAIDEMKEKTPESYRMINVERNQAWLPQLRAMLDESDSDDVLVVVGAMHLLGEDGLVEGLRDAGYGVERICSACEQGMGE